MLVASIRSKPLSRPLPSSSSRTFRITALAIAISLGTSSCATVDNFVANNSNTVNCIAGGFLGAATGAAAGALTKGDGGAIVGGAVVGAAAGCGLALAYKSRVDRLKKLAQEENLKLQVETLQTAGSTPSAAPEEAGIVAQVEDQGMFAVGSAEHAPGPASLRNRVSAPNACTSRAPAPHALLPTIATRCSAARTAGWRSSRSTTARCWSSA